MPLGRKTVSLFTGAGGLDVGFQRAGYDICWANELMPHAAATYSLNHTGGVMHCGNLNDVGDTMPVRDIFCVIGGPPCQGFSVAGKMDPSDERSQLVFRFMDIVESVKPVVFVMENVKALGKLSKFEHVREEIIRRARGSGYRVSMHLLNAKDFGVPQSRERVFIIGFREELKVNFSDDYFAQYRKGSVSLRDIFSDLGPAGTDKNPLTCRAKITLAERPIMRKSPYAGMMFNGLGRPVNTDGVSCTLPASMGGNKTPIVDEDHVFRAMPSWIEEYHARLMSGLPPLGMNDAPTGLRRLTLNEAVMIQTFPTDYKFSGPTSSQYTQIGNAVPCLLAEAVGRAVLDAVDGRAIVKDAAQQALELS